MSNHDSNLIGQTAARMYMPVSAEKCANTVFLANLAAPSICTVVEKAAFTSEFASRQESMGK